MRAIHGRHVVSVVVVVIIEADVASAPLVDPPHGLPQTIDDVLRPQGAGECHALFLGKVGQLRPLGDLRCYGEGLHRHAKKILCNHMYPPCWFIPYLHYNVSLSAAQLLFVPAAEEIF